MLSSNRLGAGEARIVSREELASQGFLRQEGASSYTSSPMMYQNRATYQSGSYPVAYPQYDSRNVITSTVQATNDYVARPIGRGMSNMAGMSQEMFQPAPDPQYDAVDMTHDYVVKPVGGVLNTGVAALGAGLLMPMGYHVGTGLNYLAKKLGSIGGHDNYGSSYGGESYGGGSYGNGQYISPSTNYAAEARSLPTSNYVGRPLSGTMPQTVYSAPTLSMSSVPISAARSYPTVSAQRIYT